MKWTISLEKTGKRASARSDVGWCSVDCLQTTKEKCDTHSVARAAAKGAFFPLLRGRLAQFDLSFAFWQQLFAECKAFLAATIFLCWWFVLSASFFVSTSALLGVSKCAENCLWITVLVPVAGGSHTFCKKHKRRKFRPTDYEIHSSGYVIYNIQLRSLQLQATPLRCAPQVWYWRKFSIRRRHFFFDCSNCTI